MSIEKTSFPSAPQAAFLLLAGFLFQYLLSIIFYDFRKVLGLTVEQLLPLVMLLGNGILIACVMHLKTSTYRDLMHPSPSSVWATFAFLVPPVLLLVPLVVFLDFALIETLQDIFPLSAWEEQAFANMVTDTLPAIVATCLIAPVVEEMLFRGILLRSFLNQYPRGIAIAYSALYFGVAHLNIYQFCLAFLLGLLLGWLFERSRSLIPCIALHMAVNGMVVVYAVLDGSAENAAAFEIPSIAWLAAGTAALTGCLTLMRLLFPRPRQVN